MPLYVGMRRIRWKGRDERGEVEDDMGDEGKGLGEKRGRNGKL